MTKFIIYYILLYHAKGESLERTSYRPAGESNMYIYIKKKILEDATSSNEKIFLVNLTKKNEMIFSTKKDGIGKKFLKIRETSSCLFTETADTPVKAIMENESIEKYFLIAEKLFFNHENRKIANGFYEFKGLNAKVETSHTKIQKIVITCKSFEGLTEIDEFERLLRGGLLQPKISYDKKNFLKIWKEKRIKKRK